MSESVWQVWEWVNQFGKCVKVTWAVMNLVDYHTWNDKKLLWYMYYKIINYFTAPWWCHKKNWLTPCYAFMHQKIRSSLFQVVACCLLCVKQLPKPCYAGSLSIRSLGTNFHENWIKIQYLNSIINGSDNGLLPAQCQAITWTNPEL